MSRIDDALRLSGRTGAVDLSLRGHPVNPFLSPWTDESVRETAAREFIPPVEPLESAPILQPADKPERVRLIPDPGDALELRRFNREFAERLALPQNDNMALVERFRSLAGMLHQAQVASGVRVLLVTSAAPADGKTLTAMNLALTLSESYGRNVLLVDVDLRRPATQRLAHFEEVGGLSQGLAAPEPKKLDVVRLTKSLTLLPAGQALSDPTRLITSSRMRDIINEASERFDWVILDAPPLGPVSDATLLKEMVDTVLLVVRAGHTRHASVKRAIETVGRERLFGVVLNAANPSASGVPEEYYGAHKPLGSLTR